MVLQNGVLRELTVTLCRPWIGGGQPAMGAALLAWLRQAPALSKLYLIWNGAGALVRDVLAAVQGRAPRQLTLEAEADGYPGGDVDWDDVPAALAAAAAAQPVQKNAGRPSHVLKYVDVPEYILGRHVDVHTHVLRHADVRRTSAHAPILSTCRKHTARKDIR